MSVTRSFHICAETESSGVWTLNQELFLGTCNQMPTQKKTKTKTQKPKQLLQAKIDVTIDKKMLAIV